jgi:CHAT domain-containing protein
MFGDCFRAFPITRHHPQPLVWKSSAEDWENLDNWTNDYLGAYYAPRQAHTYAEREEFANPLQSALLLADSHISEAPQESDPNQYLLARDGSAIDLSKCLTLDNIFTRDFSDCRLVVLSACETGLTVFSSLSDEYIGLPSGFLVAGSPSVVSSLWAINDLSTALLMMKFYQNLKTGLTVTLALNTAQNWLRNATKEELINQLDLNAAQRMQLRFELRNIDANTKLFESPYHWAAFCAMGQ